MSIEVNTENRIIRRYESGRGAVIYQIPLQLFPFLWGYAYLVIVEDEGRLYRVLIDTGSGNDESNQQLEAGLRSIGEITGLSIRLEDLTHVLITHGHIDHSGGLSYVRPRTNALVGVHELDLRNLANYDERLIVISRRLCDYLHEAGVAPDRVESLLELYSMMKSLSHSVRVDFTYERAGMQIGPFELFHVPGHTAGHVVIRLHDILFSGDHVLNDTSPHQSPEHLTHSTGLSHYIKSLDALQDWAGPIKLTLGGHKEPIIDLQARLDAIRALHVERLSKVRDLLAEPHTIDDVSRALFGQVQGYNVLLALEEAGAHVEYLYQRGELAIANLGELEGCEKPIPIYYQLFAYDTLTDERNGVEYNAVDVSD